MEKYEPFIGLVILVPIVAIVSWVVLKGREIYLTWFDNRLTNMLLSSGSLEEKYEDYINICFPAYAGLVFTVHEFEIDVYVPKENAKKVINKIFLNNISVGLLSLLFPFTLFLTVINYVSNFIKVTRN